MPAESHIRILPDQVANKIAAGEVVDRPASVLKELIENALDAGAAQIDVQVEAGGRKRILVSDNGSGMGRDDAILSIERHATSKIRDADDIENVGTLGFRGEALPAIASVSQFRLVTRREADEAGTELMVSGGTIRDVRETGCASGTEVEVRQLFFNIPARRKFLRSEQTELGHVRQVFLVYALSHPGIGFSFTADGRPVYRLAAGAALEDRLRDLFGPDLMRHVKAVCGESPEGRITGYAGLPAASRGDRAEQYIFINGRPASAPLLNHAVNEAYHTLLPHGRHPVLYLFIAMDPSLVDVNVHPAKKEVRFRHPGPLRDTVIAALREALAMPATPAAAPVSRAAEPPQPMLAIADIPRPHTFSYPRLPMVPAEPLKSGARPAPEPSGQPAPASPWSWCRVLGQVGGLYVILETEDGLVLMDPHAAHERVMFERYMKEVVQGGVHSQGLLTPETVDLGPHDAVRVRDNMDHLRKMGFGIAEFGGDSFVVDAVPTCLGQASAADLLGEVARSLDEHGSGGSERLAEESIAQGACKAAVKARDRLTLAEIEQLVVSLAGAEMPYTCPHGRPTIIFMSYGELDKKFGRV